MSAVPAARYLIEFGAATTAPAASARGRAQASRRRARRPVIEEAHAQRLRERQGRRGRPQLRGQARGAASAFAQQALASAREAWAPQEGERSWPSSCRRPAASWRRRSRTPRHACSSRSSRAELRRRAIADLRESLERAAGAGAGIGRQHLRARRTCWRRCATGSTARLGNVDLSRRTTSATCASTAGQTVLETRLGAWMAQDRGGGAVSRRARKAKSSELVIIRRRSSERRGRAQGRRVEDRLRRLHDGDDGVLPRHVADQLHGQEDADAGRHLLQSACA